MTNLEKLADPVKVLARLKKKGVKANARRKTKTDARRRQLEALITGALHDLEYVSVSAETDAVCPRPLLYEGAVVFHDLHEEVCALLTDQGEELPSPKALGAWLGSLGLQTYKGRIQRRSARDRNLRPAA